MKSIVNPSGFASVSLTSLYLAAERARESAHPQALINDPMASYLAEGKGFEILKQVMSFSEHSQLVPWTGIRTKELDEYVSDCIIDKGISQVVILACGCDTRPFRLKFPDSVAQNVSWFLTDLSPVVSEVSGAISSKLAESGELLCQNFKKVEYHPLDLRETASWENFVSTSGFDSSLPSIVVLEGLLEYIPYPGVCNIMNNARSFLMCEGSFICGTATNMATIKPHPAAVPLVNLMQFFKDMGAEPVFGTNDPLADILCSNGFEATHMICSCDKEIVEPILRGSEEVIAQLKRFLRTKEEGITEIVSYIPMNFLWFGGKGITKKEIEKEEP
ncbi:Methyltransferase Ppm1/Ppm2/Tcmp like protein [Aduncisulcus paluster]|uniref:Methyltransferase Ppm1/Ppm2/Tcmp like protein n=1 Tax=Aduncisulcus paluster TaxID=2918883 RepID=A0ABQ5KLJ8_9EUKA|nr:Methyltransferase Ppm1/Ppm2/Tcmp like protein [Aduncisulcus paluster]